MKNMQTLEDVFVVIAPSGTGKTTLNRKLISENSDKIEMSVSYTTRPKRQNEKEGEHYNFVTREVFENLIREDKMLEWANVHGNFYGTPLSEIKRIRDKSKLILLEIDIQGWQNAKNLLPGAKSVFIMPPSVDIMWSRLEGRGTDDLSVRIVRLDSAQLELEKAHMCDMFVINDSIDSAIHELEQLIMHRKVPELNREKALRHAEDLLRTIKSAEWLKKIRESFDT